MFYSFYLSYIQHGQKEAAYGSGSYVKWRNKA